MKSLGFYAAVALAFGFGFALVGGHQHPETARGPTESVAVSSVAESGEPTVIAQKAIRENFDPPDCPVVVNAVLLGDDSISALCSNGESYRVFRLAGEQIAMRCSAATRLNIAGC